MINLQQVEPIIMDRHGVLDVQDVFYTIQGEGPFVGRPAVFVRLAGCNLQCPGCDTDYTSKRVKTGVDELFKVIKKRLTQFTTLAHLADKPPAYQYRPLVVITGGEPFRQNVVPLLQLLKGKTDNPLYDFPSNLQIDVQFETNGMLPLPNGIVTGCGYQLATIVCSPKGPVHKSIVPHVTAWKYLISHDHVDDTDGLPTCVLGRPNNNSALSKPQRPPDYVVTNKIYIQPEETDDVSTNRLNLKKALYVAMKFGYTLSLQTHKMINLP